MSLPEPQVFSDLSVVSLEEMEMAALSRASQHRKAVRRELDLCVEQWALAALARWMLQHRKEMRLREDNTKPSIIDGVLPGDR